MDGTNYRGPAGGGRKNHTEPDMPPEPARVVSRGTRSQRPTLGAPWLRRITYKYLLRGYIREEKRKTKSLGAIQGPRHLSVERQPRKFGSLRDGGEGNPNEFGVCQRLSLIQRPYCFLAGLGDRLRPRPVMSPSSIAVEEVQRPKG